MLAADFVTLLIPVWILLGLVGLLGVVALLGRIQGGRYLRPVISLISKVPLFRRWMQGVECCARTTNLELATP